MTGTTVISATAEAEHAALLRARRDMTPQEHWGSEWGIWDPQSPRVTAGMREQREEWARSRRYHTQQAITQAVRDAVDGLAATLPPGTDLDGVTITVTVADLVATATATLTTEETP
jgi:phage tail protein X